MLEWLKSKDTPRLESEQRAAMVKALSAHFRLRIIGNAAAEGFTERLAEFVMDGDNPAVVGELAGGPARAVIGLDQFGASRGSENLATLIKLLPQHPSLYVRLASIYEAASNGRYAPQFSPMPGFGGGHRWLYLFLAELLHVTPKSTKILPASFVEAMIVAKEEDPSILVRGAMIVQDQQGKNQLCRWLPPPYNYFRPLAGFSGVAARHQGIVREALHQTDAGARAYALTALSALEIPISPYIEEIAELAVSNSKEVREKAVPIVQAAFADFRLLLERRAATGSSEERFHAVRLLARTGGEEERPFLQGRLAAEKSAKALDAIKELLTEANPTGSSGGQGGDGEFGLAPVPEVPVHAPLDGQVRADLRACIDEFERRSAEAFARNRLAQTRGMTRTPVSADTADKLFEALQNFVVEEGKTWQILLAPVWGDTSQVLHRFAAHPQFQLIHFVRWCLLVSGRPHIVRTDPWAQRFLIRKAFLGYQKARKHPIDLRELAAVFRAIGIDDSIIGERMLRENQYFPAPFLRTDPDAIWPYFAERLELLDEVMGLKQVVNERGAMFLRGAETRQNGFAILKLFPHIPARFAPTLWDMALGPSKTERAAAQDCFDREPDKEAKIVAALASRQQDARLAAAEWLAKLKYTAAIPALRAALAKEKSEPVKDELIRALETLGVSLEQLLDLDQLDREAEKGLKKGMPGDLVWFPFAQLPEVRWSESGKPVPPEIVHWFLVQGFKLHNAEANPTLRRYCSLFQKSDRENLGKFVLEAWIAEDTKPKHTPAEAAARAEKAAVQTAAFAKQHPQYYPDFDQQRAYQAVLNRLLVEPGGSQTGTKGILALAGACCGGDAAPIVHRYVKQWYGYRSAQSKALLQVLAWVDHPSATQVILAVANRFRTKGIQEEALRLCQLLAERKGWTLDELADRTIPTCGFDEEGVMELDFGSRTFVARLSEDVTIALSNQSGKEIASLPDPNQSDDAEKAAHSTSLLSAARKELKSVLALQRGRLYEALCTQRPWRFDDWDTYLRNHPIVGRYCQRLVWAAYDGKRVTASFRPLADGTLTNYQDDQVQLEPAVAIRLAHEQTLLPDDGSAWRQHLNDYKVEPLFQQFGRQSFVLTAELKEETAITEFMGHMVMAFSLRNRLARLGYLRGAAQDGGWFFEYRKGFTGLDLDAFIEFSGNGLPEQNRKVALQRLYFARRKADDGSGRREEIPLGELPPVLLAECWNDLRGAAAEGTGFAEDWEKQTEMSR
jgi:hypothetical protein